MIFRRDRIKAGLARPARGMLVLIVDPNKINQIDRCPRRKPH